MFTAVNYKICGRDSVVGTQTVYEVCGSGLELPWGTAFFTLVQTGPEAHSALCKRVQWLFPGDEVAGVWRWQLTTF